MKEMPDRGEYADLTIKNMDTSVSGRIEFLFGKL